jgi:tetratricopeptide (TPR) repeat protein
VYWYASLIPSTLGKDHPSTGTSLNNLAELYRLQGKYVEAEPLYRHAPEIREKALGPDHLEVGTTLWGLANIHKARGNYAEAESLFKRAMGIFEKKLNPNDRKLSASGLDFYYKPVKTRSPKAHQDSDPGQNQQSVGKEVSGGDKNKHRVPSVGRRAFEKKVCIGR